MAGQEDHWQGQSDAALNQALEQGQAAHAWHSDVEQQAGGRIRPAARALRSCVKHLLEGFGAAKTFREQAARTQQPGQGIANYILVVDEIDHR